MFSGLQYLAPPPAPAWGWERADPGVAPPAPAGPTADENGAWQSWDTLRWIYSSKAPWQFDSYSASINHMMGVG